MNRRQYKEKLKRIRLVNAETHKQRRERLNREAEAIRQQQLALERARKIQYKWDARKIAHGILRENLIKNTPKTTTGDW